MAIHVQCRERMQLVRDSTMADSHACADPERLARRAAGSVVGRASMAFVLGAVLVMVTALSGTASAEPTADDWYRLRVCESGNNYAINTGNGYYGAYQFDLGTWRSVGGTGYPNQASPAVQDALALTLYRQRGWSPWACARILGLPVRPDVAAAPPPPPPPAPPIGSLDAIQVSGTTATVAGWVLDGNAPSNSIQVHIYVGSVGYAFVAGQPAPGRERRHGSRWSARVQPRPSPCSPVRTTSAPSPSASPPATTPCSGAARCKVRTPPRAMSTRCRFPGGTSRCVVGHSTRTLQPRPTRCICTSVRTAAATVANLPRADVNSVFGIGGQHGFTAHRPAEPRAEFGVCVQHRDRRREQLADAVPHHPGAGGAGRPRRRGDRLRLAGHRLRLGARPELVGDVDSGPHLRQQRGQAFTANGARPDVNAVMGVSGRHGFSQSVPLTVGANNVCVFAIGLAADNNTLVQCKTVTYNGVQAQARQLVAAPQAAAAEPAPNADANAPAPAPASSPVNSPSDPRVPDGALRPRVRLFRRVRRCLRFTGTVECDPREHHHRRSCIDGDAGTERGLIGRVRHAQRSSRVGNATRPGRQFWRVSDVAVTGPRCRRWPGPCRRGTG